MFETKFLGAMALGMSVASAVRFAELDRNRNWQISLIDSNKDGVVSVAEMKAAGVIG